MGNDYYYTHLVSSVDRSLCYVNKEYNLGILKGIILLFMSIKFLVHTRNKIKVCALVCVSAGLTTSQTDLRHVSNLWIDETRD